MPELTIDIAVANRFISSLSKSLQALCHGCMEFDTGIEIIGYININIDSGSKVDYVLNEKVLKSTNNSMTFVSNSFLAKKDQQRHTRDGSCSPIPTIQQQITPIYQARHRGSNYGASFHRSSQFSPHSQVLHGGQKRQWGSELRSPVKKHRPAGATLEKSPSHSASYTPSTSHTFTDPNFRHSSAPTNADSIEGDSEVVNIKKEALDTDHELQDQVGEQDQSTDDPTAETSGNVIIKSDPDAVQSADSETNKDDTVATDFKGTFLDPSQEATGEQNDFSNSEKVLETISKPVLSDKHNVAGPSTEGTEDSNDTIPNSGADVSLDYDQGNEDYPQSDAGEATSDTGQFEVIEIDDEDEDVQAMFGESRSRLYRGHRHGRLRGHGLRDSHSRPDVRDMNSRPNIRDMHSMPHFRDMFSRPYMRNMLFRPDATDILSRSDTTDIRSRLETRDMLSRLDARDMLSMPDPRDLLSIPNARDLLSIPNARDFLSIPNARDLLSMPDSRDTLSRPDIKDMLSRPDARDVVSRPDARDVPPRPDARDLPPNPDARDVLSRPDARDVLSRPDTIDLLSRPDIADMHARLDRASNEFMDPNFLKAFPSYQALVGNIISCMLCPEVLPDLAALKAHLSHFHGASMPFTCSVCGKGYASSSGLKHHMHLHEGKTFMCPVCDSKFTQKSTMKTHLKGIHMSSQCPQCFQVLKIGPEYDSHMLNCVNS